MKGESQKGKFTFQAYFLLLTFYFLILTSPAQASRLQSWQFNSNQNQLNFTTDDGVQPKAQLLTNPTRLVIDLPGINFGRRQVTESYAGSVQSVRVGQFERGMTRIVVQFAPGYTIDPAQVRFRGATPRQWSVQLPTAQATGGSSANSVTVPTQVAQSGGINAKAIIQNVQPTTDGFFIRTVGTQPEIRSLRSSDRRQMYIDLYGASISPNLFPRDIPVNRNGVSRMQISQFQASPPVVRLTLSLTPDSPSWQASASSAGANGIVLLPQGGGSSPVASSPSQSDLAKIQAVELDDGNRQLLIRADQPIDYTAGWDRATGAYRIAIPSAQLDQGVRGPQLTAGSPLLQVRLRQEDPRTVAILMTPAAGIQIGDANQPERQQVALPLRRSGLFAMPPGGPSPGGARPLFPIPPRTNPGPNLPPRIPNGKPVIILDPGHGGPDPGAIGIGGLQEKGLVLEVAKHAAATLQQSGVEAVLTRNADIDLDLQPRINLAERLNGTVFVSIHANSINLSRQDISGLETYYYSSGAGLARTVHNAVLQGTGVQSRGVRRARFFVLRKTSMPSILIEVGFVTGRDDAAKLSTPEYRRQMGEAIARGILQYLGRR